MLRARIDRVDEDFEGQDMLAAQLDGVEDRVESGSEFVEEFDDNVIEENNIEEDDFDSWGSIDDNSYYNDNLDMDQQSPEFWDNLWTYVFNMDGHWWCYNLMWIRGKSNPLESLLLLMEFWKYILHSVSVEEMILGFILILVIQQKH